MIYINEDHTCIDTGNGHAFPQDLTAEQLATVEPYSNFVIYQQLKVIDEKTVRPLREGETDRVNQLKAEAATLRSQLA